MTHPLICDTIYAGGVTDGVTNKIKFVGSTETTIEDAIKAFVQFKEAEGLAPATLKSYRRNIKNFSDFCETSGVRYLTEINADIITKYKDFLRNYVTDDGTPLTVASQNTYLTLVRIIINHYIGLGKIPYFTIKLFRTPAAKSVSVYTDDEIRMMVRSDWSKSTQFSKRRNYVMAMMLLITGMRRATMINISVTDVDFKSGIIVLQHLKREDRNSLTQIPLNSDLSTILQSYICDFDLCGEGNTDGYLFPSRDGKRIDPDNVNHMLSQFCASVGITYRGCHEFRRTFATQMYANSKSAEMTQHLMCIQDSRVLRRYIVVDMDQLKAEANSMNLISQHSRGSKIKYTGGASK